MVHTCNYGVGMRDLYYDQLEGIVAALVTMTQAVREAVERATTALLQTDAEAAEEVIAGALGLGPR